MNLINELINDEQGAALAEYALLVALIAVGTIVAITTVRTSIVAIFDRVSDQLSATIS